MKPYPTDLSEPGAKEIVKAYAAKLIAHLTKAKNLVSQLEIASDTGYSESTISRLSQGKLDSNIGNLNEYFVEILKVYKVECDNIKGTLSGGTVPERTAASSSKEQNFIGSPEGNHWRIMVEIYNRRTRVRKVGIRYLKINNLKGDVTFRVKIKNHSDYSGGKGEFMFGGHQLRFVFPVTEDREKMVYMRFIIGTKSAQPSLMSGIMVHNYVDKHSNSGYIIFAENISKEDGPFEPEKMDFEKFRQWKPEIAEFFDLHNTFIHCPKDIYDIYDLRENNAARVKQNEEIAAQLAAEELKRISSIDNLTLIGQKISKL